MSGAHVRPARRRARRLVLSIATAATSYIAATVLGPAAWAEPFDTGDQPEPCWAAQVAVTASPTQGAAGHRALTLIFSLAGGAAPCTLYNYPWVDAVAGGEHIHVAPKPRGDMGGLPAGVEVPPTVTLSISTQAQAIVEGMAADGDGNSCPTYTDLLVYPPDIDTVFTVPATIQACELQVHPITAVG
jgi:Protein of unknown function (DUF4232)